MDREDKVLYQLFQKLVGMDKVHRILIFIFSSNFIYGLAVNILTINTKNNFIVLFNMIEF